ncbi:MAG: class I SAM-dependent methyltransferase [Acidobacteria bacterium]|nr:MAG: class I SAM-dependent methyltransferase [Acidobacteriota bacterium]REK02858.1 MAG: class I SAM-dependent methyltransferase [Acidobacteriota bacterium]REK13338.1 MAG: class I SAM-dependent methyltransferase [Acidobacteriota bacterium]REK41332.1 MAG: class I SAM-dependent methyltransferase [Acidobacteriota bacterium]
MDIINYNREAWDKEVDSGENPWTLPVSREVIASAREGEFSVLLTNNKPVPRDWFPADFGSVDILCLASGGGQQAPVFAALGANVTSFDNSQAQLDKDIEVAEREGLNIRVEQGDAADLSRFEDASFDLVFHPVSNCFMPNIEPVWNESARVLRAGGELLAGFHNGFFYIFDQIKAEKEGILEVRHRLPYSDIDDLNEQELEHFMKSGEPLEYGHTLDQQIGGQIRAGLAIVGFYEDSFSDEATPLNRYCPIFGATRSRKL